MNDDDAVTHLTQLEQKSPTTGIDFKSARLHDDKTEGYTMINNIYDSYEDEETMLNSHG